MSLEQALNDNTAAMRELTALLKGGVMPAAKVPTETIRDGLAGKEARSAKPAAKAEKPKAEEPAPAAELNPVGTIDRDALSKKIVEFGRAKGRDQALALLAKFNAKNLSSVPDAKLPELEAELNQAAAA